MTEPTNRRKPNLALWKRVNDAIMNENAGDVLVTLISGLTCMLIEIGACATVAQARAHLAAIILSPDDAPEPGSLLPLLHDELERLRR
jgi:hypothetical protein